MVLTQSQAGEVCIRTHSIACYFQFDYLTQITLNASGQLKHIIVAPRVPKGAAGMWPCKHHNSAQTSSLNVRIAEIYEPFSIPVSMVIKISAVSMTFWHEKIDFPQTE